MKRLWLGIGVLLGLLAVSWWVSIRTGDSHSTVARQLEEAASAALAEDWAAAGALTEQLVNGWEKSRPFSAALADHTVLDQIDAGFGRLQVFLVRQHPADFAAESAGLARLVAALGEAHRLSWENLL